MNIAFYSEVEMIGALKQMESGRSAVDVGLELGVSKHTIYAWKAKV
jgi:putative transposase